MAPTIPTLKLNSGKEMPQVGFGLWKVPNDSCADTVYNAIKTGYRLFDGAFDYGNEKEAGQGVKRAIDEGLVKREDLFIVSKLWNSFHDKEQVEPVVRKQLEWWGLEYFDLFLIHFPVALKYVDPEKKYPTEWTYYDTGKVEQSNATIRETWEAMESVAEKGLAKSIGISNFQGALMMDLLRYAKIRPAALQIEHHPYLTQPALIKYAQREGIAITAYSSFGPASFVELEFKKAAENPTLFEHDTVKSLSKKHDKTAAQVLLRWATQRGLAVIPKSNNQTRLEENLACCEFDLSQEDLDSISALERGLRFNDPADYLDDLFIFA